MGSHLASPLPTAAALLVLLVSVLVPTALAHGLVPTPDVGPLAGSGPALQPSAAAPAAARGPLGLAPAPFGTDPSGLLPGLPWESANSLRAESGTAWRPIMLDGKMVEDDQPIRGTMEFWCPPADRGTSMEDGTNTMTVRATCPYRIIDDADLMGSPQIAVHADDPESVAFFSLHGAGTTEGPTPRSRDPNPEGTATLTGLSHTTFTSPDHGVTWFDNPWGTDGFGEHVTGVMDAEGNLYIGALWSKRLGDGEFDYVVKVYKEQDGRHKISNYQPSKTFANRAAGNVIDQANLVFVPSQKIFPVPPQDENQTSNATAPADDSQLGNLTDPDAGARNHPGDRVMLVWHEKARDWRNSTTDKSSWIDAAWSDTSARDNWTRLGKDQLIGPCMAASNPVQWNGKAYVACVADAGYRGRSKAKIGDIDIWSIDPMTGETDIVAFTNLEGGQPKLTAREDGLMALTTTRVLTPDEVDVQMAWGWYGSHWQNQRPIGGILHRFASNTVHSTLPPGTPGPPPASNSVMEARITTMALSAETDTVFMVYMERVDVTDRVDTDPQNEFISSDSAIEYKKLVLTFTPCDGPTNVYDLQVGIARHPFAESIVGEATGVFDDLQDGMQTWRDEQTGDERIYFAYGDHGVIQYGALITSSSESLNLCAFPQPPPFLPAAAVPAGLSTSTAASTVVGSTVALGATAMVGYLLTVKRKSANALAAKAKK